jgi:hemerythrin HHE cation binding domain-containing protein
VDAVRLMIADHHELVKLFGGPDEGSGGGDGAGAADARDEVERQLARLRAHLTIADELLYPAVRARAPAFELATVKRADDYVHSIVDMLDGLEQLGPGTPEFQARLAGLRELYQQHQELEESAILPRAEDLLSDDDLLKLGEQMEKRRTRMLNRPSLPIQIPTPEDPARLLKQVGLILLAGVALAVLGRMRKPMRTSGPRPRRR